MGLTFLRLGWGWVAVSEEPDLSVKSRGGWNGGWGEEGGW